MSNEIENKLQGLSEEERQVALQILSEMAENGESKIYNDLLYADYNEIPVDIETFISNPRYLGNALLDDKGNKSTIYPYWVKVLKDIFPTPTEVRYNTVIFTGGIGLGKAQPLDSIILTDKGYKKNGDLSFNDMIYGSDGNLHRLVGIFPQGVKPIYRITFSDRTYTDCCEDHLWKVYNVHTKKSTVVSVKDLLNCRKLKKDYKKGYNTHRYKIPVTNPVQFPHRDVFIHPYIMGVLLGDGSLTTGFPKLTSNDIELIDKVQECLDERYKIHKINEYLSYSIVKKHKSTHYNEKYHLYIPDENEYKNEIIRYGLNTPSYEKHIPSDFLYNDVESRIYLLNGLMDTDGYISKNGSVIEYTTVSSNLKDDFIWLVQSLGGVCKVREKNTFYTDKEGNKKPGRRSYNIGIKLPHNINPFYLKRKANRINNRSFSPTRYIESIEYVGEKECQCIYIDSAEHLYLTNDFIVTHNSTIADIGNAYQLYKLLCLKNPYAHFGMQKIDTFTIGFLNNTIDNAKDVAWRKFHNMLCLSPWFLEHGTVNKLKKDREWEPIDQSGIELLAGSSVNHLIGRAAWAVFVDEVNFSAVTTDIEKVKKKMLDLVTGVSIRMQSRFMKGEKNPTVLFIASSKDDDQSFLEQFIETKRENESKTTLIIDEPQWKIRTDKDSPFKFKVALGNKFLDNEVVPLDATEEDLQDYVNKGYTLLDVPSGYYEQFKDNLDKALREIAGISTSGISRYLSGPRILRIKTKQFQNAFTKDVIEVGNGIDDKTQYYDFFDLNRIPKDLMNKPMFIHLDMSVSGDKTGIAGVWIRGKKPHVEGEPDSKEVYYQVAFSVSVKAPKGHQISFEKNRQFIYWLKEQGFKIKGVSSDTFQNADLAQQLTAQKFNYSVISVDRVATESKICEPYQYLKSSIYEERIVLYDNCKLLTQEWVSLQRLTNGKIDHPQNGSKDQSDAVCGAIWNASKHAEEYAFEYGDDLNAVLDSNESDFVDREQITVDFEDQLRKMFDPVAKRAEEQRNKNKENPSNSTPFMDFGFGAAQPYDPSMVDGGILAW